MSFTKKTLSMALNEGLSAGPWPFDRGPGWAGSSVEEGDSTAVEGAWQQVPPRHSHRTGVEFSNQHVNTNLSDLSEGDQQKAVRLLAKHARKRRERRQRRKAKQQASKATEASRPSGSPRGRWKHAAKATADAATQTAAHGPAVARGPGPRLVEASTQTEELERSPSEELGAHVECASNVVAEGELGSTQRKRTRSVSPPPRGAMCGGSVSEEPHDAPVAEGGETGAASGVVEAEQALTPSTVEVKRARVEVEEQHSGSDSEEQCSGSSADANGCCPMQAEANDQSEHTNNIDPCQRPASTDGGESNARSAKEREKRRQKKKRYNLNKQTRRKLTTASGGDEQASVETSVKTEASPKPTPYDATAAPFDASLVSFRPCLTEKCDVEGYLITIAEAMAQSRFCNAGVCSELWTESTEVLDAWDDFVLAQLEELKARLNITPCH